MTHREWLVVSGYIFWRMKCLDVIRINNLYPPFFLRSSFCLCIVWFERCATFWIEVIQQVLIGANLEPEKDNVIWSDEVTADHWDAFLPNQQTVIVWKLKPSWSQRLILGGVQFYSLSEWLWNSLWCGTCGHTKTSTSYEDNTALWNAFPLTVPGHGL